MAKNKSTKQQAPAVTEGTTTAAPAPQQPTTQGSNYTLTYRRAHPNKRCSYGVAGVAGIVVFDLGIFADGKPPATIVLDCLLAVPVTKVVKEKSATAA